MIHSTGDGWNGYLATLILVKVNQPPLSLSPLVCIMTVIQNYTQQSLVAVLVWSNSTPVTVCHNGSCTARISMTFKTSCGNFLPTLEWRCLICLYHFYVHSFLRREVTVFRTSLLITFPFILFSTGTHFCLQFLGVTTILLKLRSVCGGQKTNSQSLCYFNFHISF